MVCPKCHKEQDDIIRKKYICDECGYYFHIPAFERIRMISDKGSFEEWFSDIETINILKEVGYDEKVENAQNITGLTEAVVVGKASVYGENFCVGICDSSFLMGSMGRAVGEKLTLMIEKATEEKLPIFIFCASGGARMQEGIISLMQMEKVAAALARHSEEKLFYCSILTNPTTGGVTASFAMLGDVILAEPRALIGFAGQRVIKQTIGQDLPKEFQTAEFQQKHGFIDGIVERKRLKKVLHFLIVSNKRRDCYSNFTALSEYIEVSKIQIGLGNEKTAWERIRKVRGAYNPTTMDYIDNIFDLFVELKGDRYYGNDEAMVGGIATIDGQPVTVITQYRGKTMDESVRRNFGMPNPEGYRKSLRLMKQAEKFNRPIINIINTVGAYCGIEAEERGQGEAIARNLFEMSRLKVPILSILVGEAGSGGALALAVANEVWIMENATYSILTPEGYASIIWKDSSRASEAAEKMHIKSEELLELGVVDEIVPDMGGVTYDNITQICETLKIKIIDYLNECSKKSLQELVNSRYERFRKF